jgi:hypothetical protein
MKTFHTYALDTGVLTGNSHSISELAVAQVFTKLNTPEGHGSIEGVKDHLSQRVDVSKTPHALIDYQPPQPSEDHRWNPETKRWGLRSDVHAKIAKRESALAEIARLETELQPRLLREAAIGRADAIKKLKDIDDRITELRGHL